MFKLLTSLSSLIFYCCFCLLSTYDDRYTCLWHMMILLVKIFYSLLGVVKLFYAAAVSYAGMMGLSLTTDNNIMMMYPVVCSQGWQRRRVRAGLLCSISSIYKIYVDTRYLGCDRAQCRTLTGVWRCHHRCSGVHHQPWPWATQAALIAVQWRLYFTTDICFYQHSQRLSV